jgi:Fe-S cluster assembly protein SufD
MATSPAKMTTAQVGPAPVGLDLREAVEAVSRDRCEPDWLAGLRREAAELWADTPLPDRVAHLWRYTDPRDLLPDPSAALPVRDGPRASEWPSELRETIDSGGLSGAILVDGSGIVRSFLEPSLVRAGVFVGDLHEAARDRVDLVRSRLGTLVPAGSGKFEALASAIWRGGVLVHVPRGVEVPRPIHLWTRHGGAIEARRLLVVLDEASALTLIDEHEGGRDGKSNLYSIVESFAGPASRLRHVVVQRLGRKAVLHLTQRARAERDANVLSVIASLGGARTKADMGTFLDGIGAEVDLVGFLFGDGRRHFDHHTVHDHRAPGTASDLDFKVVLKDGARSAYTGLIRIATDAPRSEAYQENRNLLLDEGTKAESIPELEILTDEVMCTHGATVGTLDPEHLFYLESRGIPKAEARRMVVSGFIEPTLARIPEDLRERLRAHVEVGLEDL